MEVVEKYYVVKFGNKYVDDVRFTDSARTDIEHVKFTDDALSAFRFQQGYLEVWDLFQKIGGTIYELEVTENRKGEK